MARISEYKKLYGLRNKATGNLILYYWASSQKHKAIFPRKEKRLTRPIGLISTLKL